MEMCGDPVVIAGRDKRMDHDVPGARVASAEGRGSRGAGRRGGRGGGRAATELGAPSLTLP